LFFAPVVPRRQWCGGWSDTWSGSTDSESIVKLKDHIIAKRLCDDVTFKLQNALIQLPGWWSGKIPDLFSGVLSFQTLLNKT